jgi:5'-3' exonuclease
MSKVPPGKTEAGAKVPPGKTEAGAKVPPGKTEAGAKVPQDIESRYNTLIDEVILAIESYVKLIKPQQLVYIAFDGVAPRAKMNQQRQRRYKSEFMKTVCVPDQDQQSNPIPTLLSYRPQYHSTSLPVFDSPTSGIIRGQDDDPWWTTTMFTPGTRFMTMLTAQLKHRLISRPRLKYIVSASDEPGEGEHKMTQHVRDNLDMNHIIAWYGLDSDLIMLAMLHARTFREFYLFREKPEFASVLEPKSKSSTGSGPGPTSKTSPEIMYMNIHRLAESVYIELTKDVKTQSDTIIRPKVGLSQTGRPLGVIPERSVGIQENQHMWRRVYDYVFLCFFLGNDFLPHFPALNLRTHGIQVLTDTYRKYVMKSEYVYLVDIDSHTILWKQVQIMIQALATMEHELILKEYVIRDKQERQYVPIETAIQQQAVFEQLPILLRGKEKYIAPHQGGWESRYYQTLFPQHTTSGLIAHNASMNYLEALEWVFTYYVAGCRDWQWQYRYEYPPLLCDLVRQVPHAHTVFIRENKSEPSVPISSIEQLQYVLPPSQHHLIPDHIIHVLNRPNVGRSQTGGSLVRSDSIASNLGSRFATSEGMIPGRDVRSVGIQSMSTTTVTDFEWSFCKYFWESHFTLHT